MLFGLLCEKCVCVCAHLNCEIAKSFMNHFIIDSALNEEANNNSTLENNANLKKFFSYFSWHENIYNNNNNNNNKLCY